MSSVEATIEGAKRLAAFTAIDSHFPKDAKVVGIGSGSTVIYCVERIVEKKLAGEISSDVIYIPTGFQSKELIINGGLNLGAVDGYPVIDVAFDGADEVDPALNCIKGGGACLFQEKLVAECAKKFVVVADFRKNSTALGTQWLQGVPIEVVPTAHAKVRQDLLAMGAITATLRLGGKAKAGAVITDNCNVIIDAHFGKISDPVALAQKIKLLVGVVEVGLFINMATASYFGNADGSVTAKFSNGEVSQIQ
ncbi:ribose 5-phosphate isomerase A-domain-containing protein [Kockiozyma suomiensis]|uniref:ribose 5-phosphate isomerase A-domain-containing protein n=1 Tax=Kockiozyma suomiensis TaxID=1337062 RepID=UPI0033439700